MVKLFVSGFPLEIKEMELAMLIAPYGDIATLKIVRDKKTRKCKGYAFVEMLNEDGAAKAAAALDGEMMQDRELTVKISVETPQPPKRNFAPNPSRSPFVRQVPAKDDNKAKRPRRVL